MNEKILTLFSQTLRKNLFTLYQINQVTHWMDNSNVYGSTDEVAKSLRAFQDGLLKTDPCDNGLECLPLKPKRDCRGPTKKCGVAGTHSTYQLTDFASMSKNGTLTLMLHSYYTSNSR